MWRLRQAESLSVRLSQNGVNSHLFGKKRASFERPVLWSLLRRPASRPQAARDWTVSKDERKVTGVKAPSGQS
jgi:hypothetical protein